MANIYYDPEHFGVEKVTEFERSEPSWSFDTFVVWYAAETDTYYWGSDSGCSCPSPFEDFGYNETDSRIVNLLAAEDVLNDLDCGTFFQVAHAIIDSVVSSYDQRFAMAGAVTALSELRKFEQSRLEDD